MKLTQKLSIATVTLATFMSTSPVSAQTQTRDGAVVGGVAGAVIGGIIGHQNHETPEGALIGGAVGAVAGGLVGNHQQRQAQQRYQQSTYYGQPYGHRYPAYTPVNGYVVNPQPVYAYPQTVYAAPVVTQPVYVTSQPAAPQTQTAIRRGATVADLLTLSQNGVSDEVIANHVEASGLAYQVSVDDVVTMTNAGLSDDVITAVQNAPIVSSNGTLVYRAKPSPNAISSGSLSQAPASPNVMNGSPSSRPVRRVAKQQSKLVPLPSRRGNF